MGSGRMTRSVGARQEALAELFKLDHANLIGIQESRSRAQGYGQCDVFHTLSVPADARGVGGLQLWIAKKFDIGHDRIQLTSNDLRVLQAEPRFLCVLIDHPSAKFIAIVAHAPHSATEHESLEMRQRQFTTAMRALPQLPMVLMIDANARVGSVTSDFISGHQAEEETASGILFHEM